MTTQIFYLSTNFDELTFSTSEGERFYNNDDNNATSQRTDGRQRK